MTDTIGIKMTLIGRDFIEPLRPIQVAYYQQFNIACKTLEEMARLIFSVRPEAQAIRFEVGALTMEMKNIPVDETQKVYDDGYPKY